MHEAMLKCNRERELRMEAEAQLLIVREEMDKLRTDREFCMQVRQRTSALRE